MNFEHLISGLLSIGIVVLGAVWAKLGKLENRFDAFGEACRDRHDNIVKQDEVKRLENECKARHDRVRHQLEVDSELCHSGLKAMASDIVDVKEKLAYANGVHGKNCSTIGGD